MLSPAPFKAHARLLDFMRQADSSGLINLAAGVPGPDAIPLAALERAFQLALENDGSSLFTYHHPEGDHALRQLLADRLQKRGVASLNASAIVTTTGCTQALQIMISLLATPGSIVACEAPAYYGMLELLSEAQARVLPIPIDPKNGLDPEQVDRLFSEHRPVCFVLCPTLSNPSGSTLPYTARKAIVEVCRKHSVRLIEDDIYGELADPRAPTPLLAFDPEGTTVSFVSSFSKTVSPGLRVGFCVPGSLHEEFAVRKCQQDLHSGVLSECILREFLKAEALDPHLQWLRARNKKRRSIALEAIQSSFPQGTEVCDPEGGYMLWVRLNTKGTLAALHQKARSQGVVFAGGTVFFTGDAEADFIRINCAKESEANLATGLGMLGKLLL